MQDLVLILPQYITGNIYRPAANPLSALFIMKGFMYKI